MGMPADSVAFVGETSDDMGNTNDDSVALNDIGAAKDDAEDADNVDAWLIDDGDAADMGDDIVADDEDDDHDKIINHLKEALEVTRRRNSENQESNNTDNLDEAPNPIAESAALDEVGSPVEADTPDFSPSENTTEELTFEFTTPPPTATGPEGADELREYLETHLGMKPLMTFYRFTCRNSVEDAVNRAMDVFSGNQESAGQFRKLLYRLAEVELA